MRTRAIILALAGFSCGCGSRDAAHVSLHTVVALEEGFAELKLGGLAANAEPEGYRVEVGWVPMDVAEVEGARVLPGDELVTLNRGVLERRVLEKDLSVRHLKAKLGLVEAKSSHEIAQLEEERFRLDNTRKVLAAEIEATRRKDEAEIAILRTQVDLAELEVEQAKRRLDRLEALDRQGVNVYRELLDARDVYDKAVEALRIPQDELDYTLSVTGSPTRRLLELERDAVEIDLGSDGLEQGVSGEMAARRRRADLNAARAEWSWSYHRVRRDRLRELAENGSLQARSGGIVRHREGGLNTGDWLNRASAIFVLSEEDMGFEFNLPARWRNVVDVANPARPETGRVFVDVPQLGYRRLSGRIMSIAARPYNTLNGQAYRCTVGLDAPAPGLLEGLQVDCVIRAAVPPGAVAIPLWTVSDLRDPAVTMADGSTRPLIGHAVGHRFIVTDGLKAGEKVRSMPRRRPERPVRLTGVIEARESIDLRVPWRSEILEMVPEGTEVEQGEVIARLELTRRMGKEDRLRDAEFLERKAETQRDVSRLEAETKVSGAYALWQKQRLKVDDARLRFLVERYAGFSGEVEADATREKVAIALRAAERRLGEAEASAELGTVSAQAVRDARLRAEKVRLKLGKAELEAVSALRRRDWTMVWARQAECLEVEEKAAALRGEYSVWRKQSGLDGAQAEDRYQAQREDAMHMRRQVERLTVKAPHKGQVYYHFDNYRNSSRQQPLKVGRRLRTTAPFFMPLDADRRMRIEVPARFHGRVREGQEVEIHAPALGSETVRGMVTGISRHFHDSKVANDEYLLSGSVGILPRVFTALIDLELTEKQAGRVKPGVTAWMEL